MEDYRKYFATSASCSSLKNAAPLFFFFFYQYLLGFNCFFSKLIMFWELSEGAQLMGLGRLGKGVIIGRCNEVFCAKASNSKTF